MQDPTLIVFKALFKGLDVKIGDHVFTYEPQEDEFFIKAKNSRDEDVLLRTDGITLNGFVRMVHRELTEGERIKLVAQLGLMKYYGSKER